MGAILARMPAVETHVVAFNHQDVVDLTAGCQDPVDLLFGIQLGGVEDYWIATPYCERFMHTPARDAELSAAVNRKRAVSHPSWGGRSFSRNWCSACFGIDKDREANA